MGSDCFQVDKDKISFFLTERASSAIVFVIGGGNYIEYQNLVEYCKTKSKSSPKRIIYGTTELMNANRFLQQLRMLGNEMV
ncbi:SLY-1-like protein [Sarcoptes scabiei]|uniref:SLY-1-like protein n=1 Tax=Sarcoptes scabiei TaxID=52283 RepID=A0A132A3G8_SARSC|nr:SLY-1-like protein [Sarcoptes scabiei]